MIISANPNLDLRTSSYKKKERARYQNNIWPNIVVHSIDWKDRRIIYTAVFVGTQKENVYIYF